MSLTEVDKDFEKNFDAMWNIIDTKYCYLEVRNINWDSIGTVYRPLLSEITEESDLLILFSQMLEHLQDGHVNIYTPFDTSNCYSWRGDYPYNFEDFIIHGALYLGDNFHRTGGFDYALIANNSVGYLRYADFSCTFSDSDLSDIDKVVGNCAGIIIDVRDNNGGNLSTSESLASCFFKKKTHTGYICHKTGPGHNEFSAPKPMYVDPKGAAIDWSDKKVVVLCNRQSYSSTNDFVCKMLHAPNVTVIGGTTGGGGGMPLSDELPNGWMLRYSAVPMFDVDMNHVEFGIDPDIFVDMEKDENTEAKTDAIIEKGIDLILMRE